ncbi:MAG: inorganic phosphate transporter [Bacteroidota bacterium]
MLTFYLIIVIVLFILAISDLVVGVSNDAVNFLNSAVGSKVASLKWIMIVAALGIVVGCTFSSGMMEVARKGIFHPEHFYFNEIILVFLAVMVTDVILLDAFNTMGLPTSTTVSIVFELLGAAVAISLVKIYTSPDALTLGEYINSAKALAIISGILLSVVIAFTAGMIIQFLTRWLFSFDYNKRIKYLGAVWGGLAIAGITYFMLVKGAKGTSFMTEDVKNAITENTWLLIGASFVIWTIILQIITLFTKIDILKIIVMIGTFALAMAFAGNDLVNFIGVPLAGYNSYEIYKASGAAEGLLMSGLAGRVPTPTLLLLLAGIIMTITLWTSKKARSVVQTSLDLGRQYEGSERFASYPVSRSIVRTFSRASTVINKVLPSSFIKGVERQFDETPFLEKQASLGKDAPVFDMLRAAVTLVVASILISIGTNLKLPLSTTYVTFMVFMGTSLADGAWGRESAVYRVSGVLSVIGGWFFTAFSAFTMAFIVATIFFFGGPVAIVAILILAAFVIYRTHRYHGKMEEEKKAKEESLYSTPLTKEVVVQKSSTHINTHVQRMNEIITTTFDQLSQEDLKGLNKTYKAFKKLKKKTVALKSGVNQAFNNVSEDQIESVHFYALVVDYLDEMADSVGEISKQSLLHIDNHHTTLLPDQIDDLKKVHQLVVEKSGKIYTAYDQLDQQHVSSLLKVLEEVIEQVRKTRSIQIKRIKKHEVGAKNSVLFLNHLAELRNIALFSNRLVRILDDLILNDKD